MSGKRSLGRTPRIPGGAALLALAGFLLAAVASAQDPIPPITQGPSADWRTIETEHFRLHYPAPSEEWARRAAARLESIRERVVAEVGYEPPEVVDVLISDPVADPNGLAFPFLGWPRMVLWTSPPGPESVIGHYRNWPELLIVHEATHLVHLLRPSRNPVRRLLAALLPMGPITTGAPRWVTEGYATVVEGRLTGAGRPHGDLRAAILRRWAVAGKLPSYGRLAADPESFQGMGMAYLAGSAYLEWLEERAGPGSLRKLWARMTARRGRSFEEAFDGVFGDSPEDLYDRFRAEVTWRAMEAARRLAAAGADARREGELWQDLSWTTGAPAVSPDGEKIAIVLRQKDRPARLVVWGTAPDDEAEEEYREEQEKVLARDPEDVPAVRTRPLPKKALHTLESHEGPEPEAPRWLRDGRSILFVRFEPDPQGFLHPDLFLWTPGESVRRLTREADVRDPDPSPDGAWAVAVRNRHGFSQLVRVDLATGAVEALTEPSVEVIYDRPRLSPDGRRAAYALHREGAWRLVVRDLATGHETALAPPAGGTVASPAWSADGRAVYAVVGERGFIDLWAFPAADGGGAPARLTRTLGAAFAPELAPDGSGLFYLGLEPDGLDLYRLDLQEEKGTLPPVELSAELAPVVAVPAPERIEPFRLAAVPASRRYGLGRQELRTLIGGSASSAGGVWELGVRGGDLVGRLDWLAFGALSGQGWPEGGAVAAAWRGGPVEVGLHLFRSEELPSEQSGGLPGTPLALLDAERQGVELAAGWGRQWSGGRLDLTGRLLRGEVEPRRGRSLSQEIGSLSGSLAGRHRWGLWRLEHGAAAWYESGRTGGDEWARFGGGLRLGIGHDETRLQLSGWRRGSDDLRHAFDLFQLGGPESSLLPESALFQRVAVPALPVGTLLGAEYEGQRAELDLDLLPAPLFFERHRLWPEGGPRGDWLRLAGLEWRLAIEPLPIGRVPSLDLRVGVARVLDPPFEQDDRWWFIAVWRP